MKEGATTNTTPEDLTPMPITLGRIIRAAATLLEREMTQVIDEWLDANVRCSAESKYTVARQALTIMLLCRNLADETRRYENETRWIEAEDLDF